jgi:septal ring factor EnvC (AmiA/AmiB activator)
MTFCKLRKSGALFVLAALTLSLTAGCARGPSQKELGVLEENRQATEAAEQQVTQKKAKKAELERQLAEKKAEKKALEEKRDGTAEALAGMSGE